MMQQEAFDIQQPFGMREPVVEAKRVEKSKHYISLIISLVVWVLIVSRLGCHFAGIDAVDCSDYSHYWDCDTCGSGYYSYSSCPSDCDKYEVCDGFCDVWSNILFWIFFPMAYFGYLIECYCSGSRKYLTNDMQVMEYSKFLNEVKQSPPTISIKIDCWHTEIRYRTVSYTDANGNMQTRQESYTETVITYTEIQNFHFSIWEDMTGEPIGVKDNNLTKLQVNKTFIFGNDISHQLFEQQRMRMIELNRYRDLHISDYTLLDIPNYLEKVLVRNEYIPISPYLGLKYFWIASFLTMSWAYRIWFENQAEGREITIIKKVTV